MKKFFVTALLFAALLIISGSLPMVPATPVPRIPERTLALGPNGSSYFSSQVLEGNGKTTQFYARYSDLQVIRRPGKVLKPP